MVCVLHTIYSLTSESRSVQKFCSERNKNKYKREICQKIKPQVVYELVENTKTAYTKGRCEAFRRRRIKMRRRKENASVRSDTDPLTTETRGEEERDGYNRQSERQRQAPREIDCMYLARKSKNKVKNTGVSFSLQPVCRLCRRRRSIPGIARLLVQHGTQQYPSQWVRKRGKGKPFWR